MIKARAFEGFPRLGIITKIISAASPREITPFISHENLTTVVTGADDPRRDIRAREEKQRKWILARTFGAFTVAIFEARAIEDDRWATPPWAPLNDRVAMFGEYAGGDG